MGSPALRRGRAALAGGGYHGPFGRQKKTVRTVAGRGTMTAATDDTAGRMTLETFAVPDVTGDDHVRGPADAPVTVVEYGDYECPYCRGAARDVDRMLEQFPGQVRFVFRNFPIVQLHPHAEQAAEAAEAAAAQGQFWPMYDLLLRPGAALDLDALLDYAADLGLDTDRFRR